MINTNYELIENKLNLLLALHRYEKLTLNFAVIIYTHK